LKHGSLKRESLWTNNLAVGSRQYVEQNQHKFGRQYKIKALPAPSFKIKQYGEVRFKDDCLQDYAIGESQIAYDADYTPENWALRGENAVFWDDFPLTT